MAAEKLDCRSPPTKKSGGRRRHPKPGHQDGDRGRARDEGECGSPQQGSSQQGSSQQEISQRGNLPRSQPLDTSLAVDPLIPQPITSVRHKVLFELVETPHTNKKLEYTIVQDVLPPKGFTFVACGNVDLTYACKDLAREREEQVYYVSPSCPLGRFVGSARMEEQINRVGYHFLATTVQEALAAVGTACVIRAAANSVHTVQGLVPSDARAYLNQVESAFLELFPLMPQGDRKVIIDCAFHWHPAKRLPAPPVGLQFEIPFTNRVHLATLAHIRHQHTEYDELLRRGSDKSFARTAVRSRCIELLVKWRGDDECGREYFKEILREVIVIEDTDDEDDEPGSLNNSADTKLDARSRLLEREAAISETTGRRVERQTWEREASSPRLCGPEKHDRRGFKRYHAYEEAFRRGTKADAAALVPASRDNMREQNVTYQLPSDGTDVTAFGCVGNAPSANGFVRQMPYMQSSRASDAMLVSSIEPPDASMPLGSERLLQRLRNYPAHYARPASRGNKNAIPKSYTSPNRQVMSDPWGVSRRHGRALSSMDRIPVGQDRGLPEAEPYKYPYGNESMELEVNGFVEIPRPVSASFHASAHDSEVPRSHLRRGLPQSVESRDGHDLKPPAKAYDGLHHQSSRQALFNGERPHRRRKKNHQDRSFPS